MNLNARALQECAIRTLPSWIFRISTGLDAQLHDLQTSGIHRSVESVPIDTTTMIDMGSLVSSNSTRRCPSDRRLNWDC